MDCTCALSFTSFPSAGHPVTCMYMYMWVHVTVLVLLCSPAFHPLATQSHGEHDSAGGEVRAASEGIVAWTRGVAAILPGTCRQCHLSLSFVLYSDLCLHKL